MLHKHTPTTKAGGHRAPNAGKSKHSLSNSYKLLRDDLQELALDGNFQRQNKHSVINSHYTIPQSGIPEETAFDLVHNELTLDGNPHLNLASFVNTTASDTARRLIAENIEKNLADNDEYPQMVEITQRCISMLAQLWKAGPDQEPLGCATTGSSEAIMLGGLAMKRQWERRMKAANKPISKPNIIMSSAAQVALEKFARYFDVECRLVPVSHESDHHLDPSKLWDFVDENTIGCFVILGTTYTGHLESIEEVADVLSQIEKQNPSWSNSSIPIHVDGASGGFVVPFAFTDKQMADYKLPRWGFNHPRVVSINASGHKFGLTTAGLGWILWKDDDYLLPELRFKLTYLGGVEETFNLNFSRPGYQVIHQYYNFLNLGMKGYKDEFEKSLFAARYFSLSLLQSDEFKGKFDIISSVHERIDGKESVLKDCMKEPQLFKPGVPLSAFKLSKEFREKYPEIPQALISSLLRAKGWIVPNYPLPASTDGSDKWEVLRVVFRSEMSLDLVQMFLVHIHQVIAKLERCYASVPESLSGESKKDAVYKMLLILASPESAEISEEVNKKKKKNYRGTC
ncbi:LANO_0E07316g1_1 [Lachancea nothofagi CBS 11611]|uniref:Glutamate decarboxylase n=1 Tax=Lachancea nothofagi CBS 11611 TaxID=1266666 RepID=A0A1G4JUQ9_9SACH|nr:LANO_0E07316g1_1 [Lachancea nothofagi CBS 11611]